MKNRSKRKKRHIYFLLLFALLILLAAFILYRFIIFNLWITSDAGVLQPYPRVLIENEIRISHPVLSSGKDVALIEKAIMDANSKDRIVLNLSRSNIRFNFFKTKSYVKVFLQTAIPDDRSKTTSIKFLNILVKKGDSWRVRTTQDISIE